MIIYTSKDEIQKAFSYLKRDRINRLIKNGFIVIVHDQRGKKLGYYIK